MKKRIILLILIILCSVIIPISLFVNADTAITEDVLTCDDIVDTSGGTVEFKKIDPLFDTYNINNHSDTIDTVNTIDEVLVLGTQSSNTVFTFKTHLNRDNLTKYFNILEWFIVPTKVQPYGEPNYGHEYSDSDFESFEVTIRDVNNKDKYVIFKTSNRPDSNEYNTTVSGRAGANNQSIEGIHTSEPDKINKTWGTALKASHVGSFSDYDGVPQGFDNKLPLGGFLALDYETKQVFSVTGSDRGKRVLVRDLDDGRYMIGTDIPWDGFDSTELEVSIRFINIVSGRTAQVAILSYNGMDFTKGRVIDYNPPLVIEKTVLDEDNLYGEINRPMPITECFAYDLLDGFIYDINYKVFYNYGETNQKEISIVDNKFTPDRYGTYSIVASAKDRSGNVGKNVRNVEIRKGINDLHLSLLDELDSNAKVGERISIPKAIVYGGSINKKYSVSVLYNDKNVEISSDNYFIPLKQGVYTLRYTVTDYYDTPIYFDYPILTYIDEAPVVYFPLVDEVVEVGNKLVIPEFSAIDYSSFSDGVNAKVTYAIKEPSNGVYKEITKDYIPKEEGEYKFKIIASNILNNTSVSKEYSFYAKECKFIRDFFVTDNMSIDNLDGEMVFTASNGDSSFYFLNPVLTSMVEFDFKAINANENAPKLVITLTDSVNKNHSVTLNILKNKADSSVLSNQDSSVVIAGAISTAKIPFDIVYSNGWVYDGLNAVLKITNYDNGDEFDGFESGKAYVNISLYNSINETTIQFSKFCGNQDFSYNADDITEPTIIYTDLNRLYKIGDEVSFNYDSFDLFDKYCSATVRVEYNGKVLSTGKDGYCSFEITEFGKYNVIFKAIDKFSNETSLSFNIYCYDNISPTIMVNGTVTKSIKLGESISLPSAKVSDNVDQNLTYSIYAQRPTGSFVIIDSDSFSPDVTGIWTIYYYTVDSCGNYSLLSFAVTVS